MQQLLESMAQLKKLHHRTSFAYGINRTEFFTLRSIEAGIRKSGACGLRMSELGRLHDISPPAISQMVKALEKKGYVRRSTSEEDRRVVYVSLTAEGKEILSKTSRDMLLFSQRIMESLSLEDMEALTKLLGKLCLVTEEVIDTYYTERNDS